MLKISSRIISSKDFKNIFSKLIFVSTEKLEFGLNVELLIQLLSSSISSKLWLHSRLGKLSLSKINFELIFSNLFLSSEVVASEMFVVSVDEVVDDYWVVIVESTIVVIVDDTNESLFETSLPPQNETKNNKRIPNIRSII